MAFRNLFSFRKTKPRKFVSRSPLKLPALELAREFGSQYQTIDACIGNQKMTYNIAQADWMPGHFFINLFNNIFIFLFRRNYWCTSYFTRNDEIRKN
jgi:hypothetical protein